MLFHWVGYSFFFMDCVPTVTSELKAPHWALKEWPVENRGFVLNSHIQRLVLPWTQVLSSIPGPALALYIPTLACTQLLG